MTVPSQSACQRVCVVWGDDGDELILPLAACCGCGRRSRPAPLRRTEARSDWAWALDTAARARAALSPSPCGQWRCRRVVGHLLRARVNESMDRGSTAAEGCHCHECGVAVDDARENRIIDGTLRMMQKRVRSTCDDAHAHGSRNGGSAKLSSNGFTERVLDLGTRQLRREGPPKCTAWHGM